jgi:hypothetical protein
VITRERLIAFSLTGVIAYTLAYYFDWPLFRYYLAEGRLHFTAQAESAGPPILLYGWVATAALVALAIALVLPRSLSARIPADLLWLIPLAAILAAFLYELRWFV